MWIDIKGYEGFYQVSDKGQVKSLERKCKTKGGRYRTVQESLLRLFPNKSRYNYLCCNLNNKGLKTVKVHRLVAEYFVPNPENKPQVNHKDGDKTNNSKDNLEWCTGQENIDHAWSTGLMTSRAGDSAPNTKLSSEKVLLIRTELGKGATGRSVALKFNISESMISLIKNKKHWK